MLTIKGGRTFTSITCQSWRMGLALQAIVPRSIANISQEATSRRPPGAIETLLSTRAGDGGKFVLVCPSNLIAPMAITIVAVVIALSG